MPGRNDNLPNLFEELEKNIDNREKIKSIKEKLKKIDVNELLERFKPITLEEPTKLALKSSIISILNSLTSDYIQEGDIHKSFNLIKEVLDTSQKFDLECIFHLDSTRNMMHLLTQLINRNEELKKENIDLEFSLKMIKSEMVHVSENYWRLREKSFEEDVDQIYQVFRNMSFELNSLLNETKRYSINSKVLERIEIILRDKESLNYSDFIKIVKSIRNEFE